MLGVLPFVEDPDLSCTAGTAVSQHLPPCKAPWILAENKLNFAAEDCSILDQNSYAWIGISTILRRLFALCHSIMKKKQHLKEKVASSLDQVAQDDTNTVRWERKVLLEAI